ncbi:PLD-like domain-containing protein [Peptoclostridium litorale DSM 5388]|uniref:51.5 kDa protein n=1 Tax=Peptoclostridium litorale DSM 5388 TaxID=1121324 RepID=A0A069RED1_PEPLI|nr:DEAD/DEAH box helicase family protein [Peptoclostridium litorale]KDR94545.1 51.5 kDa protein [Peptoclostridium litorale DSM 5388]SIO31219.1 PLD-like domain-containing protein [Peptoclostridium litorale DSM 5388]
MSNAIIGNTVRLYDPLIKEIEKSKEIKIIVSFLMESGVKLIVKDMKKRVFKGCTVKIITGTYLNITEPSALYLLKSELGELVDLRFYSNERISFHPKTYIFRNGEEGNLFIGSSNISKSALTTGIEWNYRLSRDMSPVDFDEFEKRFDYIFENESNELTDEELRKYASNWKRTKILKDNIGEPSGEEVEKPEPRGAQIEALYELENAREEGVEKGVVVAATGVGKTYLAAFDSEQYNKVLFVAHRSEILKQAEKTFKSVKPNLKTSYFDGDNKDTLGKVVFASVQTLGKGDYLNKDFFEREHFDYVIIDEFHHAAAKSYRKVIDYFKPKFLLGLTATPYRMDAKDIFELCDDNIIYEINLKDAINRDLLVPFRYYGIYDDIDYSDLHVKNGKYSEKDLEKVLATNKRADFVLKSYRNMKGKRAIGFCSSVKHAEYMAAHFNENGIKAAAVHSGRDISEYRLERGVAIENLENNEIEVIFAVDIFNEGVDIPSIDTVLFLRPTESYVVFLQQLGRGLRKYEEKEYLNVLDFIGNYKRAHHKPFFLAGINPLNFGDGKTKKSRIDEIEFPEGCSVSFDFKLIDLFEEMKKNDPLRERMADEYRRLKESIGRRPLRCDLYEGVDIDIKHYLKNGYIQFLNSIEELEGAEKKWVGSIAYEFLKEIEKTRMTKSYKIPVLKSFVKDGELKGKASLDEIGKSFMEFYTDSKFHQKDLNNSNHKNWKNWGAEKFNKLAFENPIDAFLKSGFFYYDEINRELCIVEELSEYLDENMKIHFEDILNYKNTNYFKRRFKGSE